jgi:hypothetical protein
MMRELLKVRRMRLNRDHAACRKDLGGLENKRANVRANIHDHLDGKRPEAREPILIENEVLDDCSEVTGVRPDRADKRTDADVIRMRLKPRNIEKTS